MAKKGKKTTSRRRSFTIGLAAVAGIIGALYEPLDALIRKKDLLGAGACLCQNATGYEILTGNWNPARLPRFWAPIAFGVGGSILASRMGVNRKLAAARVPVLRV